MLVASVGPRQGGTHYSVATCDSTSHYPQTRLETTIRTVTSKSYHIVHHIFAQLLIPGGPRPLTVSSYKLRRCRHSQTSSSLTVSTLSCLSAALEPGGTIALIHPPLLARCVLHRPHRCYLHPRRHAKTGSNRLISHELLLIIHHTTFLPVKCCIALDARCTYSLRYSTDVRGVSTYTSQPIKGTFDHHLLLFAVEFTNTRRGHRILVASVVFERFLEYLSRARVDMRPSSLVSRFLLHPTHFTRHTAEHFLQLLKRERAQFFNSDDCDTLTKPAHLPLFHEVVVQFARNEDDPFGMTRSHEWVG